MSGVNIDPPSSHLWGKERVEKERRNYAKIFIVMWFVIVIVVVVINAVLYEL